MRLLMVVALVSGFATTARAQDSTLRVLVIPRRAFVHCARDSGSTGAAPGVRVRTMNLGIPLEWRTIELRYSDSSPGYSFLDYGYHSDSLGGHLVSIGARFEFDTLVGFRIRHDEKENGAQRTPSRLEPLSSSEIQQVKRIVDLVRHSSCEANSRRPSGVSGSLR